ncbi:hypothetical protein F5Y17DRAFT_252048 [Xylariaceae sp. FL0594]|nr:hypothetical protein F5Y17DRAFT_252048 [Xylariaceae sp. FL0594]
MRPRTPAVDLGHTSAGAKPTSPPETPTATSPSLDRAVASGEKLSPQAAAAMRQFKSSGSNIRPLGGNKFSYSRDPRPDEISPRSSASSDEGSDSSESLSQSHPSDIQGYHRRLGFQFTTAAAAIAALNVNGATIRIEEACFVVEELSDYSVDSDDIDLDIIRPDAIECAGGSERSRTGSYRSHELDPAMTTGFEDMKAFDSDSEYDENDDFQSSLIQRRMERRIRRMKSGSISKRTISERDSESDNEDLLPWMDPQETLLSHRRVRRRGDHRSSIQYTRPLMPERIPELKEPNSDDEVIIDDHELFARELPYFSFMEVDYA